MIFHKSSSGSTSHSTTILVVFKNASRFIQSCIAGLLSQNDVRQILLVNDFSDDGSASYADSMQTESLRLYHAIHNLPGKKSALQEGIRQVKSEIILLTDVDCQAASQNWAHLMSTYFNDDVDIVLGYSPMVPEPSFLNRFIRFETWMTALQYMSYALAKMPYMGVGRNLAYKRSITADFEPDHSILSGDDDLFVAAQATTDNTRVCLDPDAFVFTEGKKTFGDFYRQKRRHMTTSHHYSYLHKGLLTLFSLSQMLVLLLCLILVSMSTYRDQVISLFTMYVFIKWIMAFPLLKTFKEDSLFFLFPILDICFSIYLWMMSMTIFTPTKTWN